MAWWKMEKSTKAKLGNAVSRHAQSAYNLQSIQSQCLIAVLHQHGPCQLRLISSNMLMLLCWCSGMWLSSVHVSSWYYILIAKADVIKLVLKQCDNVYNFCKIIANLRQKNVEKPLPSSQLRQPPPNTEVLPANVVGSPGQKKTNSFPVDPNQDVLSWLSVLFCDFPSLRFVTLISCTMTLPSFTMNHMSCFCKFLVDGFSFVFMRHMCFSHDSHFFYCDSQGIT